MSFRGQKFTLCFYINQSQGTFSIIYPQENKIFSGLGNVPAHLLIQDISIVRNYITDNFLPKNDLETKFIDQNPIAQTVLTPSETFWLSALKEIIKTQSYNHVNANLTEILIPSDEKFLKRNTLVMKPFCYSFFASYEDQNDTIGEITYTRLIDYVWKKPLSVKKLKKSVAIQIDILANLLAVNEKISNPLQIFLVKEPNSIRAVEILNKRSMKFSDKVRFEIQLMDEYRFEDSLLRKKKLVNVREPQQIFQIAKPYKEDKLLTRYLKLGRVLFIILALEFTNFQCDDATTIR